MSQTPRKPLTFQRPHNALGDVVKTSSKIAARVSGFHQAPVGRIHPRERAEGVTAVIPHTARRKSEE